MGLTNRDWATEAGHDRPLATPLQRRVSPASARRGRHADWRHFVRNNGSIPERALRQDAQDWSLTVDGEVRNQRAFSLDDLHSLPQVTLKVVLECAGNGRSSFAPTVGGTQWIRGAVACSEWTGCACAMCCRRSK